MMIFTPNCQLLVVDLKTAKGEVFGTVLMLVRYQVSMISDIGKPLANYKSCLARTACYLRVTICWVVGTKLKQITNN